MGFVLCGMCCERSELLMFVCSANIVHLLCGNITRSQRTAAIAGAQNIRLIIKETRVHNVMFPQ